MQPNVKPAPDKWTQMRPLLYVILGCLVLLFGVSIAENGSNTPDERSLTDILGVAPEAATAETLATLSKSDLRQVFLRAEAPAAGELVGDFRGELIGPGILSYATEFYTHRVFGPGAWIGKSFSADGKGVNLFAAEDGAVLREREVETRVEPGALDEKPVLFIDYSCCNSLNLATMRDEVRRINKNLYLGMGYMALGGGSLNPASFSLAPMPTTPTTNSARNPAKAPPPKKLPAN